ncbi:RNA polymerase-associated protein RapA [Magnetovirga frankeli]|uniref:RNA polymerase-associated protein RapA n=1 Tax=Magnetovirga frankeli TaxID=947516 RepID=UPI001293933C|nr:RNA polymerase-associated protein RapA [gamma proteobacterium SS-5]
MDDFSPGQRWVSDAEPELGLGLITALDARTLSLDFPACGESRTYARRDPPLSRVLFAVGDQALSAEGWALQVESVEFLDGLACYLGSREDGSEAVLPETQLDHRIRLNRPADRLFGGRYDRNGWFELRYQTHRLRHRLMRSPLRGLTGGRTSLIPHQLYIAREVSRRYAPRVLLADEVGLGKTIEAGMILHQQLLTGRASRVLILLPESLQHQWLVEMLRRFNLRFSLFDEERCQAIDADGETANPFHAEQLILTRIDFLSQSPERLEQAQAAGWDLLVVDEAHHLRWSPEGASAEYRCVEQLAARTLGLLLLTATPEQLGKASHFAHLRLLDPDRFHDLDGFLAEESAYAPIAHCLHSLLENRPLSPADRTLLAGTLGEGDNQALLARVLEPPAEAGSAEAPQLQARRELMDHLMDRHGTGRVLFRNSRRAIRGFPQRRLSLYPLDNPAALLDEAANPASANPRLDTRIDWLIEQLRWLYPHRVLLITAQADTTERLAESLRRRIGLQAALFHEGMSLLERDRAAAFFADPEGGCRLLICSEIGSEGRNFQFAHHLILFDLPLNPGLLEQRIGRLDRIGQRKDIQIHLPYPQASPQHWLARFYHEGLNAFEQSSPASQLVFDELREDLLLALDVGEGLDELIERARQRHAQLSEELRRGRDPLLEYNSCRPHLAEGLLQQAKAEQQPIQLVNYLEHLFDGFDIDSTPLSAQSFLLRPGQRTPEGLFPGLTEDGLACTSDRACALANEQLAYLSWEHPLLESAMEAICGSGFGNSSLCSLEKCGLKPGTPMIECIFLLQASAERHLQVSRYLPPTPLRLLLDPQGRSLGRQITPELIREKRKSINREQARQLIKTCTPLLQPLLDSAEQALLQQTPKLIEQARQQAEQTLGAEIDRLIALQQSNPNVRQTEIDHFRQELEQVLKAIENAEVHLDALRLLVAV